MAQDISQRIQYLDYIKQEYSFAMQYNPSIVTGKDRKADLLKLREELKTKLEIENLKLKNKSK